MIEGKDYELINGHLKIFDNVTIISMWDFGRMNIASVEIPEGVTGIGACAFWNNQLTRVKIPKSVTYISPSAFDSNSLEYVSIPSSVISIGSNAFSNNKLKEVKLSENLTVLKVGVFQNNNLISIEIPDSVQKIENFAFHNNNLTIVEIPRSVTHIGKSAFDDIDVIYDGVLISRDLVQKYGCENIIKLYEISKIMLLEEISSIFSKNVLTIIPSTSDAIKGYIRNKKDFNIFISEFDVKDEEYQDIFKMCFALGNFNNLGDEIYKIISQIINEKGIDYIHQMWTSVTLTEFKPKFKELFVKLYKEGNLEYNGQNIIERLYSSFEKIYKYTLKRHEDIIGKKNTEIKRLKELGANTIYLEQELEVLKKNKKNISYDDICYYLKNNVFDIREGNEELNDVAETLSVHMEQEGFDKIQDIYEKSIGAEKSIPLTKDTSNNEFRYHWSKSDNPVNTILGYLVGCCAKLGGAGEDIMIQSMINPDIANLILYDENNNIIGKATAYYNRSKKYILFNNAETKSITSKGLKSEKQRQKECLEALIRGAMDAVNALKERGEAISEVRIGMVRNDLENAIREYGLEISYDLLDAYNWNDYAGDASDVSAGQTIIYRDKDKIPKEKNI